MSKMLTAIKSAINSLEDNDILDEKHHQGIIMNDKLIGEAVIVKTKNYTIRLDIHCKIAEE